ncbi:MAG: DegQ family serine endoprotease [Gammaproteobacteria bacterium]|nr:DegQ family serine endoprotease [Gammaproteobacteria bacterium]
MSVMNLRAAGLLLATLLLPPVTFSQAASLPDFTQIVEANSPAVVNISTTQKADRKKGMNPHGRMPHPGPGAPFDDFFRRFFDEDKGGEGGGDQEEPDGFDSKSLGSGFIMSPDGYVLTNYHVIKDADEVVVRLSDRRELVAKVVGSDKRSDVALLKIEASDLPAVKIGNPKNLKVGEWVLAIGSPFDFDHTVTAGIVSALRRSLPSENYVPFIQTDVAINPGNSGGPLFNLNGEVVGMNSQIYSRTGGYMGLSFAIPMDLAMNVVDQLKSGGKVSRGWLGVLVQDVNRELAESFGMKTPGGAVVARVLPDSPASQAGFKTGDVVVEFDGKEVDSSSALPPLVGSTRIGQKVPVKVIRDRKPMTLNVTVGELPTEDEETKLAGVPAPEGALDKRLGVAVADLTPDDRKVLAAEDKGGVLVQRVKDGPAQKAGVRNGDILVMLNGVKVESAAHFKRLSAELPAGKSVPLLIQRRGDPIWLALKVVQDKK